jgi:hypothetical protein
MLVVLVVIFSNAPTASARLNHPSPRTTGETGVTGVTGDPWPTGVSELHIVDGRIQPGNQLVGKYTSMLQSAIDGCYEPPLTPAEQASHSVYNTTNLRKLVIEGDYLVDAPLLLPSLFVLQASESTFVPAANLSVAKTNRFDAMIMMKGVSYTAVLGGTFDGSSLPPHDQNSSFGLMALSITGGGGHNAIRGVRALSNNSDSIIGINQSPHAEVANCDVGGSVDVMLQTRCVWTLATDHALVHDNHVHNCSKHALDLDAYTSESVAYSNLCEGNGQEGIFLEETAARCSLFNNTCRWNENGIGLYTLDVGPVADNFVLGNTMVENRRYGLSVGGLGGEDETKRSTRNVFATNYIARNNLDQSPTQWGDAPVSQVNPVHGGVSGDYWTNNVVENGGVEGAPKMEYDGDKEKQLDFVVFEPDAALA